MSGEVGQRPSSLEYSDFPRVALRLYHLVTSIHSFRDVGQADFGFVSGPNSGLILGEAFGSRLFDNESIV